MSVKDSGTNGADLIGSTAALQNAPSTVAALVLDAQPGMHVLDMCSAPGGKTAALAEAMQDTGTIVALDRSREKVERTRAMMKGLGHGCVDVRVHDATRLLHPGAACPRRDGAEPHGALLCGSTVRSTGVQLVLQAAEYTVHRGGRTPE